MAQPAAPFSLRFLAREVIREQGVVNMPEARYAAASVILRRIPPQYRTQAAIEAMACFVEKLVTQQRTKLRPVPADPETGTLAALDGDDDQAGPEADEEAAPIPIRQPQASSHPGGGHGNANSASSPTDAFMRKIGRLLRDTTYASVPDKSLGDYTTEDIEVVAAYLETKASELAEKASRYRELGSYMAAAGVKIVRDLPPEVLNEVLRDRTAA